MDAFAYIFQLCITATKTNVCASDAILTNMGTFAFSNQIQLITHHFAWIYPFVDITLVVFQNTVDMETLTFTHWGRVTHVCVGNLTIIGSDNGLSPGRRQAIIWNNAVILSIGLLGTNFSEFLIEILTISFKKMRLKVASAKWRPFGLGFNELSPNRYWKCCVVFLWVCYQPLSDMITSEWGHIMKTHKNGQRIMTSRAFYWLQKMYF